MLRYLFEVRGAEEYGAAVRVLRAESNPGDPEMETIADMLRREGEERRFQRGVQKGQRELLLLQLEARFGEVPESARRPVPPGCMTGPFG